jgi:hypothetical protein
MFENQMKKNSVAMNANHFAASVGSVRLPRVMLLRVRS